MVSPQETVDVRRRTQVPMLRLPGRVRFDRTFSYEQENGDEVRPLRSVFSGSYGGSGVPFVHAKASA